MNRKKENAPAQEAEAFSLAERKAYFKKKWRREHIGLLVVLLLLLAAALVLPFVFGRPWFVGLAPLIALVEYGWQNNKMMIYVESNLFD